MTDFYEFLHQLGGESEEEVSSRKTALASLSPLETHSLRARESPFDRLQELQDEEEQLRSLISRLRRFLPTNGRYRKRLARRLEYLLEVAKEEAPDQALPRRDSLRGFVRFMEHMLKEVPSLEYPEVALTPTGNVWVEWRTAPSKQFVAEFQPDGSVGYVIFAPDPERADGRSSVSGEASLSRSLEALKKLGDIRWFVRKSPARARRK
jgi:hypothetical protein